MTQLTIDTEAFERDGYLVIPNAFTKQELQQIKDQMNKLIDQYDPETHKKSTFDTINQKQKDDQYFLNSGRNISFFLEDNVFDQNGKLKVPKHKALNKVGHGMHDADPVFQKFSYHPTLLKAVKAIGHQAPKIVQSMYIFKSPFVGGEITPHQDTTFIQTQPHSCIGTWVGLEDANKENGCMWVVPGSHKHGVKKWFNLNDQGTACAFDKPDYKYDIENAVCVEVTAGSLVLLHGAVVHFSGHNHSSESRNAYTLHVIDGAPDVEYLKTNWLRETAEMPFKDFEKTTRELYGDEIVDKYI